jgi:hypothetical protein
MLSQKVCNPAISLVRGVAGFLQGFQSMHEVCNSNISVISRNVEAPISIKTLFI